MTPILVYSDFSLINSTVRIDIAARRLSVTHQLFGIERWTKTVVDCQLEDCVSIGTVEYCTEGKIYFGTYFKLRNGYQHSIPVKDKTFAACSAVIKQIAAATGIPRLDTRYP
jgi:hypothetical protein